MVGRSETTGQVGKGSARHQAEQGHRGLDVGFREVDLGRVVRVGGRKGKGEEGRSPSRFGVNTSF